MLESFARWIADPSVRDWWLLFCMVVLVAPMAGLGFWYHRKVNDTTGGRDLMQRHARGGSTPDLGEGLSMARDIHVRKYGAETALLQHRVYWVVALWLLANVIVFGLLIYSDEIFTPTLS